MCFIACFKFQIFNFQDYIVSMDLICEKHQDKVDSTQPRCVHPDEYCKFRTSCMISFLEKENEWEQRKKERGIKKND